jgi:transglutaminase-like putative cysteine protease
MLDLYPTKLAYEVELDYEVRSSNCDFVFCVQAAQTAQQWVAHERFTVNQAVQPRFLQAPHSSNRLVHLRALQGHLTVRYEAHVDVVFHHAAPAHVSETWIPDLPPEVMPYLFPSRYCESDLLGEFAIREFGAMWQGYSRVQAICEWVQRHISFESGSSVSSTTALQTLRDRRGVCRDFAHVMIALCRALNLPARFTTGLDYGADPILGPPDFHAYVEVFLSGRWYLFDPSGTAIPRGLLRIASALDAADSAYANLYGDVRPLGRRLLVNIRPDASGHFHYPQRTAEALSTA